MCNEEKLFYPLNLILQICCQLQPIVSRDEPKTMCLVQFLHLKIKLSVLLLTENHSGIQASIYFGILNAYRNSNGGILFNLSHNKTRFRDPKCGYIC